MESLVAKHLIEVEKPDTDLENHGNRDRLMVREAELQAEFEEKKTHERTRDETKKPFLVTFPYPYVNGTLHLGHAYTLLHADVPTRFRQLQGYHAMFPFAFHGTGMPIVACAQRLTDELATGEDPTTAPTGSQTRTLLDMEISVEELPKFQDPEYWLDYFPRVGIPDLKRLGIMTDFRRSFTTTPVNPHYDSFIRWQFEVMQKEGFITFGKRHVIYSPKDGQPCADHDRLKGEEVKPKEYSLILLPLKQASPETWKKLASCPQALDQIHLAVATLRPETMYGQTNVWIHPEGKYQLARVQGQLILAQPRTFDNLEYQLEDVSRIPELELTGADLLGAQVRAPLSRVADEQGWIPVLPLNQVQPEVGTGIVTSVPSNSPTDYLGLKEFLAREARTEILEQQRQLLQKRWEKGTLFTPIIDLHGRTDTTAQECESRKLSLKKKPELEAFHQQVYRDEFHEGIFVATGEPCPVPEAQEQTKQLLAKEEALRPYWEPESPVISRSRERCVVALTDQWFINYGDPRIKEPATQYLEKGGLKILTPESESQFREKLAWLGEWPVSRRFGLGTKLGDTEEKIDSLSDSTIYMAYYTIAHLITQLPVSQLTFETWEAIFRSGELPTHLTEKEQAVIQEMRAEFEYWYPVQLRVSAADLIGNHLLMSLLTHIMIWPTQPEKWPQAYALNGYTLLNGEKMSKSTGNFMTLREAHRKYGADPVRFAMIESGEGIHDANFTEVNAENMIMRLTRERYWVEEMLAEIPKMEPKEPELWERVFQHQMRILQRQAQQNYEQVRLRKVICEGVYPLLQIRDTYRELIKGGLIRPCPQTLTQALEFFLLMMAPLTPHWSEDLWQKAEKSEVKLSRSWITPEPGDQKYQWYSDFLHRLTNQLRNELSKQRKIMSRRKEEYSRGTHQIEVAISTGFTPDELALLLEIEGAFEKEYTQEKWKALNSQLIQKSPTPQLRGKRGRFSKYVWSQIEKYGPTWLEFVNHPGLFEEVQRWVPLMVRRDMRLEIYATVTPPGQEFINGIGYFEMTILESPPSQKEVVSG